MAKRVRVYTYEPVLFDRMNGGHAPEPGTQVVKTQPFGTPKNGTMGMCYVMDATTGDFYGMVCVNSLVPGGTVEKPLTADERRRAERDAANEARYARARARYGR
jgi:NAD(P)-dependent dehydrogenase (short-subunit alcohol dehydrogenase family)